MEGDFIHFLMAKPTSVNSKTDIFMEKEHIHAHHKIYLP